MLFPFLRPSTLTPALSPPRPRPPIPKWVSPWTTTPLKPSHLALENSPKSKPSMVVESADAIPILVGNLVKTFPWQPRPTELDVSLGSKEWVSCFGFFHSLRLSKIHGTKIEQAPELYSVGTLQPQECLPAIEAQVSQELSSLAATPKVTLRRCSKTPTYISSSAAAQTWLQTKVYVSDMDLPTRLSLKTLQRASGTR